jgi:hypothetical protein
MKYLKAIANIILFIFLTILTQIGGIAFLLSRITYRWTDKWAKNRVAKISYRWLSFLVIYGIATLFIVPIFAKPFGRVPLPFTPTNHVQPLNVLTCILNRHYVRPSLQHAIYNAAQQMNQQYKGTKINYLDACFPFINKFPLIPHLSHNDGKKIDLSFCYKDSARDMPTNACPSFIGYGICEEPLPDEENTALRCASKGYWQYNTLRKIIPQNRKKDFTFDTQRTKTLVELLSKQDEIGKIFIEPHLKTRLQLTSSKIRFHGCQAVRHDDHIHAQLK